MDNIVKVSCDTYNGTEWLQAFDSIVLKQAEGGSIWAEGQGCRSLERSKVCKGYEQPHSQGSCWKIRLSEALWWSYNSWDWGLDYRGGSSKQIQPQHQNITAADIIYSYNEVHCWTPDSDLHMKDNLCAFSTMKISSSVNPGAWLFPPPQAALRSESLKPAASTFTFMCSE